MQPHLITLVETTTGHLETKLAVIDINILEGPAPVPSGVYTDLRVVDGDISDGELLVADPDTEFAAIEDEVTHEASRAILHEDTCQQLSFRSTRKGRYVPW